MISGVNSIIFINMLAYPIPLPSILQQKRSAELAGIGHITGSIEKGKSADMIVTAKNPLKDLRALRNLEMVIAKGSLFDHPKIKKRNRLKKSWISFYNFSFTPRDYN